MNDDQIRLAILLDYYEALKNGSSIPYQDRSKRLQMIDKQKYEFNYAYLAQRRLVKGSPSFGTFGDEHWVPIGGLTAEGTTVVKTFIDQCIERTNADLRSSLTSYLDKIVELGTIWASNSDLYNQAVELFAALLRSLGL